MEPTITQRQLAEALDQYMALHAKQPEKFLDNPGNEYGTNVSALLFAIAHGKLADYNMDP